MFARNRRRLVRMEAQLLAQPARWMFRSANWADDVKAEAGVYVVWTARSGLPAYVGQTTCLRDRLRDIGRVVNYTFRRKAAALLKVPLGDERALSEAMSRKYKVSFLEVQLGRAELEDYLRLRWRGTILNGPTKRLLRGSRYRWVRRYEPD